VDSLVECHGGNGAWGTAGGTSACGVERDNCDLCSRPRSSSGYNGGFQCAGTGDLSGTAARRRGLLEGMQRASRLL